MNTTQTIGFRTNGYAVGKLLKRAQALMILERFGQVDPQGQNKSLTRKDSTALAKFRKLVDKDPILALACDFIAGKPKLTEIEAEVVDEKPKISSTTPPPPEPVKPNEPPQEENNTGLN